LQRVQAHPELAGLYHLVASGATSWHGYATLVIEHARKAGVDIKVPQSAIHKIATQAYPTQAKRPLNSKLDTLKLQTAFNLHLPPWQHGVTRMLTEIL
jgi:dTDP-4-dehydrorhamnose reductase